MRALGIIPARGGSKGIPNKNLVPLAGKPLLAYSCEQALAAKSLQRVIVSTDSEEIAACARKFGVEAPFLRPKELAADDTPMLEVLRHAVSALPEKPEIVVLLQPTSPLRKARHIDEAVRLLAESGADSVVSVTAVPHQYLPGSLMKLDGGRLSAWTDGPQASRRQEKPPLYARNGPAVLAVRAGALERHGLYEGDVRALVMEPEESVDIDGLRDLALAEALLVKR